MLQMYRLWIQRWGSDHTEASDRGAESLYMDGKVTALEVKSEYEYERGWN